MADVLTVRDARKSYGKQEALRGASISLGEGEWVGLLGPNGAGKTTLVRSVAGRVRLDGGEITLLGDSIGADDAKGARDALGVVPQDIALYPLLTAQENLVAFGALHGVAARALANRVKWALEWTGLADRADDLVKGFSGGMKRRLNIACGVLHEPAVILLDEPTVGVDPQSRQRIWEMLGELRASGASMVLTTHQLDEAEHVCDRVTIIDHGKDIADGTLDELIEATVGAGRRVRVTLDGDADEIVRHVESIASELPALIGEIESAGNRIRDLHVERPTLQAVFIHLTGRELRE